MGGMVIRNPQQPEAVAVKYFVFTLRNAVNFVVLSPELPVHHLKYSSPKCRNRQILASSPLHGDALRYYAPSMLSDDTRALSVLFDDIHAAAILPNEAHAPCMLIDDAK